MPDGLSWADLRGAFDVLGKADVIGFEITEYEASWPDGTPNDPAMLITAIEPVLAKLRAN